MKQFPDYIKFKKKYIYSFSQPNDNKFLPRYFHHFEKSLYANLKIITFSYNLENYDISS